MSIPGKQNINIGLPNQSANSDSLFEAFNKVKTNFDILFASGIPLASFKDGTGISITEDPNTSQIQITNTGVTQLIPGAGISVTGSTGNITISASAVSNSAIRSLFSGTGLITYNNATGAIGTTADNYNRWQLQTDDPETSHFVTSNSIMRITGGTNVTVENDGGNIIINSDASTSLPEGGTEFSLLEKASGTDFDTRWTDVATVKGLQLDTVNQADAATGRIIWNDGDEVPQFQSNGITVNISLEMLARCRNVTGNLIPKGTPVCILGASANRISIGPSDRTQPGSACRTLGLTLEDIETDEFGKVSTFGLVRGLDTAEIDGDEGDELYVGATPGSLTTTPPDAPARRLTVGYLVTKNPNNGRIFVSIRRGVRVREIDDVQITDVDNNDFLRYVDANNRWENVQVNTDTIAEGNANLYFTEARAKQAVLSKEAPVSSKGDEGDLKGDIAFDDEYFYYCTVDYTDGLTDIWKRIAWNNDTWDNE